MHSTLIAAYVYTWSFNFFFKNCASSNALLGSKAERQKKKKKAVSYCDIKL